MDRIDRIGWAATIVARDPQLNGRVVWYRGMHCGYDWVQFVDGGDWFVWDFGSLCFDVDFDRSCP